MEKIGEKIIHFQENSEGIGFKVVYAEEMREYIVEYEEPVSHTCI
jgi:hypothetical protein